MTPPSPDDTTSAGARPEGFGARLRKAREARGMGVLELADGLRLSPRMIEAIESEDLGALPPILFAKGYLRSYAAFVGIDPSGVLKDFEARAASATTLQPPPPMRRPIGDLNDVKRGRQLASLILLALVLSAFAWWWSRTGDPSATDPVSADVGEHDPDLASGGPEALAFGTEPPASAEQTAAVDPKSAAMDGEAVPRAAPATEGDEPGDLPAASPPALQQPAPPPPETPVAAQTAGTQAPTADAATAQLKIRYAEDCWTEVRDERGRQLIYRLAKAGSEQEVTGTPPFSLYLGYAPGVAVEIDGKPVALSALVGNSTVARIKLDRPRE